MSLIFLVVSMLLCTPSLTLFNPVNRSPPHSSVRGIFQAGILEWVAISFPRGSWPRDLTPVTCICRVSCIGRGILYHCATREACGYLWRTVTELTTVTDGNTGEPQWVPKACGLRGGRVGLGAGLSVFRGGCPPPPLPTIHTGLAPWLWWWGVCGRERKQLLRRSDFFPSHWFGKMSQFEQRPLERHPLDGFIWSVLTKSLF